MSVGLQPTSEPAKDADARAVVEAALEVALDRSILSRALGAVFRPAIFGHGADLRLLLLTV